MTLKYLTQETINLKMLTDVIWFFRKNIGEMAVMKFLEMQIGNVEQTFEDIEHRKIQLCYEPLTGIYYGKEKFIYWFNSYHQY